MNESNISYSNNISFNYISTTSNQSNVQLEEVNYLYVSSDLINFLKGKRYIVKPYHVDFKYHYYYIYSTIYYLSVVDKRNKNADYVSVHYQTLEKVVSKYKLNEILKNLISWGIIETNNKYIPDIKSKGYRITEAFKNKVRRLKVRDNLMNKKLSEFKAKQHKAIDELPSPYQVLRDNVEKIEINYKLANKYNRNNYLNAGFIRKRNKEVRLIDVYNSNIYSINSISERQYYTTVDKFGNRFHSNLTNLSSDLRQFISVENTNLTYIDISNSQPLFLYLAIKDITYIPTEEKLRYKELVESGNFYEYFIPVYPLMPREELKVRILTGLFFDRNRVAVDKLVDYFNQYFPNIYKFIKEIKQNDYTAISSLLQKTEAKYVIEKIVGRWITEYPDRWINTIHDSIVVKNEDTNTALDVLNYIFRKEGIKANLKIKTY